MTDRVPAEPSGHNARDRTGANRPPARTDLARENLTHDL
jgi:hypothetical protein